MGKLYQQKVLWEFRCLLQGYGRDVREALLDALRQKGDDVSNPRNKALLEAIERNEVALIREEMVEPAPTWVPPPPDAEIVRMAHELVEVEMAERNLLTAVFIKQHPEVPIDQIEIVIERDGGNLKMSVRRKLR